MEGGGFMTAIHLPSELEAEIREVAQNRGMSIEDFVADNLRREASSRRILGDILDAAGSDLDEDEIMAYAVAVTHQVRRERTRLTS
jgi:hypothetical protein